MMNYLKLVSWVIRGKTLTRSMLNTKLAELPHLNGVTLDLGGGGNPSYKDVLKINGQFVNMDAIAEANPTVVGDLESDLPFCDEYADTCILFNTLEHVYDYQHVVNEIYRVTKVGGNALIYVPFMFPVHTHQSEKFLVDDFFRYTESTLKRIFDQAGFKIYQIEPCGGLFFVIAELLTIALRFRVLGILVTLICVFIEPINNAMRKNLNARNYPLAYFVTAVK